MQIPRLRFSGCFGLALVLALAVLPAQAAGFGIFEQGTKAMGLANAFTAQADDPSAMFFNVGGLAFINEREFQVGVTLIFLGDSDFSGANPFPGEGYTASQEKNVVTPIHFYYAQPLTENLTFGLALYNPFGLVTEWADQDNFAGRYISEKAELTTFDLNANIGWKATERFGFGFGLIVRAAELELHRRAGLVNPFTLAVSDIAHVELASDLDTGFGWNIGILHRPTDRFSWGLSYRSKVKVDFGGTAKFEQILTGYTDFDNAVGATLPFGTDVPIETSLEFPDMASLGVAYKFADSVLAELDINWAGWSSYDQIDIKFTDAPALDQTIEGNWSDSYNYRVGVRWTRPKDEFRFGVYYDESPQPEEGVGPLLPDADRVGYTIGYGRGFSKVSTDFGLMYLDFDKRKTETNLDGFNGSYKTQAWLLAVTLGF